MKSLRNTLAPGQPGDSKLSMKRKQLHHFADFNNGICWVLRRKYTKYHFFPESPIPLATLPDLFRTFLDKDT